MDIRIVIIDGNLPETVDPVEYKRCVAGAVEDAFPEADVDVELKRNCVGCGGGIWVDGDPECGEAERIRKIMDDFCDL